MSPLARCETRPIRKRTPAFELTRARESRTFVAPVVRKQQIRGYRRERLKVASISWEQVSQTVEGGFFARFVRTRGPCWGRGGGGARSAAGRDLVSLRRGTPAPPRSSNREARAAHCCVRSLRSSRTMVTLLAVTGAATAGASPRALEAQFLGQLD